MSGKTSTAGNRLGHHHDASVIEEEAAGNSGSRVDCRAQQSGERRMASTAGLNAWPQGSEMDAANMDAGLAADAKVFAVASVLYCRSLSILTATGVPAVEAHTAASSAGMDIARKR